MNKQILLKKLLLFPVLIFAGLICRSQVLSESFNSTTFPPAGWLNVQLDVESEGGGANVFAYATVSTQTSPNAIAPNSGAGMALYDGYSFEDGDSAELVTPALNLSTGGPYKVSFWMYRDQRYRTLDDSMEIFINATTQTGVGGTKLGVVHRHYLNAPVEAAVGWYKYSINIPATFNGTTNYISFFGNSGYGTEMLLDDVVVEGLPPINGSIVDIITPAGCDAGGTVTVRLKNGGSAPIAAGAATVALYVNGTNPQGPLTLSNPAAIPVGDTISLDFATSFLIDGDNVDSAFIQSLAGDTNYEDDSLVTSHITLPAAVLAPYSEDFEGDVPGWLVTQSAGSGNWGLDFSLYYPDLADAGYELAPKSGSSIAVFDSWTYPSGTRSVLTTNCITLPADANTGCGYVVGFYFAHDAQYTNLDSMVIRVSADGGNIFSRLGKVKRQDSTLSPSEEQRESSIPEWRLYTYDIGNYAGQTLQFELEAYGLYGNPMGIDSFFVGPKTIATNVSLVGGPDNGVNLSPALTACTDAGGWTYYTDGTSSRYVFAVQWDAAGTGANSAAKAQATAKITVDRKWFAAEDDASMRATYTMQRYWDINLNGAVLESPVNVRFFYSQREMDSIILAKDDFIAAHPGSIDEGFVWFKTTAGAFVPSTTSVTPDAVQNAIPLADANNSNATINGILYAQFNGVTSFSGGTAASGVGPTTPVPVSLLSFNAQRTGRVNKITWTTSQEINTSRFVIERSFTGRDYTAIGQLSAAGNSTNSRDYSFIDNTPARGINYYRLRIVDIDNSAKFSAVRNVRNEGTADVAVYPNPVSDVMQVNITSDRMDKATISITDMNGKAVYVKAASLNEGANYLNVNTSNFSSGTYVIKIQLNNDLIVRKFNRL